ncbi:MAG: restriction endonuclease [Acholeplasma sp.]|nr:restriction endonuclease [Acholeplasma sp.]
MTKKKKELTFDDILETIYYFLKDKLKFDDIQAITLLASIFLIPVSLFLGFFYTRIETFQISLYIILGLDFFVIAYSIIKYKYFKNKRIDFIEKLEKKSKEVKNIDDIDELDPLEFEIFVRDFFIKKGYKAWTTKRTYDNGADVLAEKGNERIAIQVKHSSKTLSAFAVYQTREGKINYKADKAILVTNNELTNKAKLSAIRDVIEVIDRNDISLFLRKNPSITITYKKQ